MNTRWWQKLYVQVLFAVGVGIIVGILFPSNPSVPGQWDASRLKPLGDGFIALVRMMIGPIVFCTIVHGVASVNDMKKLGRVGVKTLVYFELVSTIALAVGLLIVNWLKPGAGFDIDPATIDPEISRGYSKRAEAQSVGAFLLNAVPATLISAFVTGDLLQILLVSVLAAFSIAQMPADHRAVVLHVIERANEILFGILRIVVRFAPLGAFGAMAFTVANYGLRSLGNLGKLMFGFYATSAIFIFLVLGGIAAFCGFSIIRFISFIREELFLVLGTSSSETALPGIMQKLRRLGCAGSTVGLVIPTGYSFNLDGTNIYLTMAAVFLAQATNTPLDLREQIALLLVAMISSKGASGVTGAGFVTLAATLAVVPKVPIASLALLVGIDRFMSECRAITNLIGNGVATVAISRWEGEVSSDTLRKNLAGSPEPSTAASIP
jgi:aerobic C4-dicarboxylate transport protein